MAAIVNKLMFSGVFLLFMILSYGVISTEERLLKSTDGNNSLNYQQLRRYRLKAAADSVPVPPPVSNDSTNSTLAGTVSNVEKGDDYRPTEPGHSPGAGHDHGQSDEPGTVELNQ